MSLLLILIVLVLIVGVGGGGYYGSRSGWWGSGGAGPGINPYVNPGNPYQVGGMENSVTPRITNGSPFLIILVIVVLLLIFGAFGYGHFY
jgi:hypothetical protein